MKLTEEMQLTEEQVLALKCCAPWILETECSVFNASQLKDLMGYQSKDSLYKYLRKNDVTRYYFRGSLRIPRLGIVEQILRENEISCEF